MATKTTKALELMMEALREEKRSLYATARRTKSKLISEACREYAAKKGIELLKMSILLEREQTTTGKIEPRKPL